MGQNIIKGKILALLVLSQRPLVSQSLVKTFVQAHIVPSVHYLITLWDLNMVLSVPPKSPFLSNLALTLSKHILLNQLVLFGLPRIRHLFLRFGRVPPGLFCSHLHFTW